jgi:hypothetical protein
MLFCVVQDNGYPGEHFLLPALARKTKLNVHEIIHVFHRPRLSPLCRKLWEAKFNAPGWLQFPLRALLSQ